MVRCDRSTQHWTIADPEGRPGVIAAPYNMQYFYIKFACKLCMCNYVVYCTEKVHILSCACGNRNGCHRRQWSLLLRCAVVKLEIEAHQIAAATQQQTLSIRTCEKFAVTKQNAGV